MAQSPKNDSVIARSYQLELLDEIKKSNTILYLPTGCGKTYIAIMLVKYMGECLTKPIGNGRKWTFFIVHSVPLVSQQADNLRRHLPWNIGTFSGDMHIDYWSQEQWDQILEKCHILVMTAQIYLNNLHHGFMHIKDANLLIFDECHHAVASHPFRQIMQVLHNSNLKSDERPHILGLTATLINSKTKNIKDELHKLQITFDSTIKTKYDENIHKFSAHPEEFICLYDEYILDNELITITYRISKMVNHLRIVQDKPKNETTLETDDIYYLEEQNKESTNKLENYFLDIELHLNDGGAYIGYLNALHFMLEIEKKKKRSKDIEKSYILSLALSELTIIRKMLYDYLNKHSIIHENHSTTIQNVSPKIKKLMEHLSALKATDACLVFVLRRTTAKTLCHYINDYIQEYNQKNIVCEFIVGKRGLFGNDCIGNQYKQPQTNDVIKNFNSNITNVLITSQVLEEGIDIQSCNVVIRYDSPNNFTSYKQSKGRARSATSKFITMVPNLSYLEYKGTHNGFTKMEEDIEKILAVNDIEDEENNDYNDDNNMPIIFKTKHGILNYANAPTIVNSYCASLPQDRFSDLKPEWYIAQDENNRTKYKLTLPINSIIKTPIEGIFCKNKKNAKKSAAFNACIELYKIGALDEFLRPVSNENNAMLNDLKWFPHWDDEDIELSKHKSKTGTHKITRTVHAPSPTCLHGSYPQVNKPSYLHVIHCDPDHIQLRESKYEAFDKLLKSIKEYGILTSDKLPQVSSFPIFLHFGNVNVSIKVNVDVICFDHKTLKELDNFHNKLFIDVLGIKNFVARSYDNGDNSYLVVPIFLTDNIYHLDWNVININKFVETEEKPTMEQRNSKFYEEYLSSINVISPWYRNVSPVQRYIVTDVYTDMTPESSFKSTKYDTYAQYFSDNHGIHVSHKNQPLIKVKSLDVSKINYLTPRHFLHKIDKQTEKNEILIPEFCTWHKFPSDYWIKALMLPTILYRFEKLLLAEELFEKINSKCNIGVEGDTNKFDPKNFPDHIERIREPKMSGLQNNQSFMYNQSGENNNIKHQQSNLPSKIKFKSHCKLQDGSLKFNTELFQKQIDDVLQIVLNEMIPLNLTNNPPPILSPLIKEVSKQNIRPEQSDILKALTPPKAQDIFSYECMETYGDSFLKYAASLVLFDACPLYDEGLLSTLRTKMVGNRNLYYVGRNSNIESYMVNNFDPSTDWIPPCFGVPQKIKDTIENSNISSVALHQIIIPKDNQITGMLSDETWSKIENQLLEFKKFSMFNREDKNDIPLLRHSKSNIFIHKKSFSDKMVADCVESLIGTYVYNCGVKVGFKVLHGLGIIPEQFIDTFKPKPIKSLNNDLNISKILPGYEILEQRIGYSFEHKNLLVQALTHPTNEFGISECYQRFEFLGDAIIDFLITSYIIEHGNTKTPGEITDIRSSLVNNSILGSLSVRIGLHRFVLAQSVKMTEAIDRFCQYFQKNNYTIGQEVLYLVEENDCYAAESIDVPKVLGDLFESLIAAIYLDCKRDLNVVWTICYKFLENEIKEFCNNIPKNPMNILYNSNLQPIFSTPDAADEALNKGLGTMIQLKININQKSLIVYGFGQNKKEAKIAAAKMALKNMKKIS